MADPTYPTVVQTVLDTPDPRALAEFYRALLGLSYRPGDEPPADGEPDPNGADWLVLTGGFPLAFQYVPRLTPTTWPDPQVPQQLHLDITVASTDELEHHSRRAVELGARVLRDRSDDPEEPLRVFADPAGHPFCLFVR